MATIQGVYVALFGRPADPTGLAYFNGVTNNGANLSAIGNLASTAEYQGRFAGLNNLQIINSIYQSLFGRDADVTGLNFFANQLATGRQTINTIAINILDGATGSDLTTVNNKIAAANLYTAALDTGTEIVAYSGTAAADAGRTFLQGVTTTVPAQTAVDAAVLQMVNNSNTNPGLTLALTDSTDILSGNAGNDTFIAGLKGTAATLTAGDSINGGAGTDRLDLVGNANGTAFTGANIQSVEQVFFQASASGAAVNVSGNAGVTQAWINKADVSDNAAGTVGVTLTKAQTAGIAGASVANATNGNSAFTFTFTDVGGSADTVNLALNGAKLSTTGTGAASVTVAGAETINIAATGSNSIGTLTADNTSTLNISGAGSVSLTAGGTGTFKTVDASTNTGGVTVNLGGIAAADLKVTGGTGNDSITTKFADLTKADVINLGTGTDTVLFSDATSITTAADIAKLGGFSGVEVIGATGAVALTVDAGLTDIGTFRADTSGAVTLTNLVNTDSVQFGAVTAAASTAGLALGSNTFNLTLAGSASAASNLNAGLTVTGSTTVNVVSNGTAGVADNVLKITTADNNLINVTGSQNLTLTTLVSGGVTGETIDASAFTGKLNVTGTGIADVIKGGAGADIINGGAGSDVLTGGAGADTFTFTSAAASSTSGTTFGQFDSITDFVVGTDKLQFSTADVVSGQQSAVQAAVTALAAGATETQIATAMATANTTNLGVSFATYGGNTYVLYETTGAGTGVAADDVFIKLVGVTTAPTFANDVIA